MNTVSNHRNLVLYMPEDFRGVGGIQMLIVNIAQELAKAVYGETRLLVCCSRSSFVAAEVSKTANSRIRLHHWESGRPEISDDSLLVLWGGCRAAMQFDHHNPRVLMWCVAPGQPFAHFKPVRKRLPMLGPLLARRRSRVIDYLVQTRGIAAMDSSNREDVRSLIGQHLDFPYLPIGIPVSENEWIKATRASNSDSPLKIAWIGRGAVEWKVIPFINLLRTAVLPDDGIDVVIFTDQAELYQRMAAECAIDPDLVRIRFKYGAFGSAIRNELASSQDIVFGMGLSALEGASVGVPSVYVAPQGNFRELPSWQWLFDRYELDFSNGAPPTKPCIPFDFAEIANRRATLAVASPKCHEFVMTNYEISRIVRMLLNHDTKAHLRDYLDAHGLLIRCAASWGAR
jgi:hypothetical protein